MVPQLRVPHAADALTGEQPHTLTEPPPPHVCGEVQLPQLIVPPQPSGTPSQFLPAHATAVVLGVHPHTFGVVPPPHVCGAVQLLAHATVCPQLLSTLPQRAPFWHVCAEVSGRHPHTPMTPPPPHVWPVPEQLLEHWIVWLQLFAMGPHLPVHVVAIGSSTHALHCPAAVLHPKGQAVSGPH